LGKGEKIIRGGERHPSGSKKKGLALPARQKGGGGFRRRSTSGKSEQKRGKLRYEGREKDCETAQNKENVSGGPNEGGRRGLKWPAKNYAGDM